MKPLHFFPTLLLVSILCACHQSGVYNPEAGNTVNGVIGDVSYIETFGAAPDELTDENLRIATHLAYVEDLLRSKDVSHLSAEMQQRRNMMLDLLREYRLAGEFPKNYDHEGQRKPCFIDQDGNICAVGYLVEQTVGRKVAEEINARYQYASIYDMDWTLLDRWITSSGLTLEECAMIQPAYGWQQPNQNYIEPAYGISTAALTGINTSFMALNAAQLANMGGSRAIPLLGLATGTGQVALGVLKFPQEQKTWNGVQSNESQKVLSLINIGIGASTMILSTYNLLANRNLNEKMYTWNLYSYPVADNQMGVGFSLTRRF